MAVDPTWKISVDLTGDGDFGDANEDVTADVQEVSWGIGFTQAYQHIPMPYRCSFTLDNGATNSAATPGRYSPEHASALVGFKPGRAIQIQSTYSATTRIHSTNWIAPDGLRPEPFRYMGEKRTKVECEDWLARAQKYPVAGVSLQVGKRYNEIVLEILNILRLYPPATTGYWVLGESILGTSTRLSGGVSDWSSFETGISVFPYALDNAPQQKKQVANLYAILKGLAESERGWIFTGRDGKVVGWNRHHLLKKTSADTSFSNTFSQMAYDYGADIANVIVGQCHPRTREAALGSYDLGTLDKSIPISVSGTAVATIKFADASGNPVSSSGIVAPVPTTDYTANTKSDGSGYDITDKVTCAMVAGAQSAKLTFTNTGTRPGYIVAGTRVRGTDRITDYGQLELSAEDIASISLYGRRPMSIDARELEDADHLQSMINWEMMNRKIPRGCGKRIGFYPRKSAALMTQALTRTVGDRVTIIETQTGLSADFYIMGEFHTLRNGFRDYLCEWVLQPIATLSPWILGTSRLGTETLLGA